MIYTPEELEMIKQDLSENISLKHVTKAFLVRRSLNLISDLQEVLTPAPKPTEETITPLFVASFSAESMGAEAFRAMASVSSFVKKVSRGPALVDILLGTLTFILSSKEETFTDDQVIYLRILAEECHGTHRTLSTIRPLGTEPTTETNTSAPEDGLKTEDIDAQSNQTT